jgi:hypothetical protein
MTSDVPKRKRTGRSWPSRRATLMATVLFALVALAMLIGAPPDLLRPAGETKGGGGLGVLVEHLKDIEGPGEAVLGSLSGLGLIAGGGMTAMGMQQGIRIMMTAGLAGGGVILGKGLMM